MLNRGKIDGEVYIDLLESGDKLLHYVGGIHKDQAPELYNIPLSDDIPLNNKSLKDQTAYRTEMEVLGRNVTVVMVHNPELEHGQSQGIPINREKATSRLFELQQQLVRHANGEVKRGCKPTVECLRFI